MRRQRVCLYTGERRKELLEALKVIGTRTKAGAFTKKAQEAQKKYHSTISIMRKLKRVKTVYHFDEA